MKRRSFDVYQLFSWSSLKWRNFEIDLAKIKHISMMMCHLIAYSNCRRWIANGTKLRGVKSNFWNFRCKIQLTLNFRGIIYNLPYIICLLFILALKFLYAVFVTKDVQMLQMVWAQTDSPNPPLKDWYGLV